MPMDLLPDSATTPLAYWLALTSAALRGVRDDAASLPAPPPALADLVSSGSPARRILDGLAVTWPLVFHPAPLLPPYRESKISPPRPAAHAEVDQLWTEILDDPAARHWPEKKITLTTELLQHHWRNREPARHIPVPSWHLPALLNLAVIDKSFRPPSPFKQFLKWSLTPDQEAFTGQRQEWVTTLYPPITELPNFRQVTDTVKDQHVPLVWRKHALDQLVIQVEMDFAKKLARLALRCLRLTDDSFAVTPLDPAWHADWLPAAVLPPLPAGIAPRDILLARAYSLLSLVPVFRWFGKGVSKTQYRDQFVPRLLASEQPAALAYAFAGSLTVHAATDWAPQITELYSQAPFAEIFDQLRLLDRLSAQYLPGYANNWLSERILQHPTLSPHSPLLQVLLRLRPLDRRLFERAAKAILNHILKDPASVTSLKPALHSLALHSELYWNAKSLRALNQLAESSPLTAEVWQEAHSLLLFRFRMRDAFEAHYLQSIRDYPFA